VSSVTADLLISAGCRFFVRGALFTNGMLV